MNQIITLESLSAEDKIWESYFEFQKMYNQKHSLEEIEDFKRFKELAMASLTSRFDFKRNLLLQNKKVVGLFNTFLLNKNLPEEIIEIRILFLENSIIKEFELQLKELIEFCKKDSKKLKINVSDAVVLELFKSQSFSLGNKDSWFELEIQNVNDKLITDIIAKETPKKYNLSVELNQELQGNEFKEIAELMTVLLNDMQRKNVHQVFKETEENVKEIVLTHKQWKNNLYHLLLRNDKNKLIGMSIVLFKKENPKYVNQYMTGVLKEYRGFGLSSWMKAYVYDYLKKEFPSVEFIKTDCFSDNLPMVHINKKFGFKEVETTVEMIYEKIN